MVEKVVTPPTERPAMYRVPEQNIGRLRGDIERLAKRAKRLGLPEIAVVVHSTEQVEKVGANGLTEQRTYYWVDVTGTTPRLDGWTFIGSLSHLEGTDVLITTAAGREMPDQYKKADPTNCDHCHTKRDRSTTFIVEHEDGRLMQVGRQCLADFIRTTDPQALASQATFLTSLDFADYEEDDERGDREGYWNGPDRSRVAAVDFMVACQRAAQARGEFVSKKRSMEAGFEHGHPKLPSTVEDAQDVNFTLVPMTAEEVERAEQAITWARDWTSRPDLGDYEQNVATVARMEFLPRKALGVFASILGAMAREQARTKADTVRKEQHKDAKHIGTVGKRETFTLTLVREKLLSEDDRRSGTFYRKLYAFIDAEGNEVSYFASRPLYVPTTEMQTERKVKWDKKTNAPVRTCGAPHEGLGHNLYPLNDPNRPICETVYEDVPVAVEKPLTVGDTVTMKATVKAHEEFRGVPQTLITRATLTKLVAAGEAGK